MYNEIIHLTLIKTIFLPVPWSIFWALSAFLVRSFQASLLGQVTLKSHKITNFQHLSSFLASSNLCPLFRPFALFPKAQLLKATKSDGVGLSYWLTLAPRIWHQRPDTCLVKGGRQCSTLAKRLGIQSRWPFWGWQRHIATWPPSHGVEPAPQAALQLKSSRLLPLRPLNQRRRRPRPPFPSEREERCRESLSSWQTLLKKTWAEFLHKNLFQVKKAKWQLKLFKK